MSPGDGGERPASRSDAWSSEEYVAHWSEGDALEDVLAFPRRISTELVGDAGLEVTHVVDLGAGAGAYLGAFLDAFPSARGTWVDASEPMLRRARHDLSRFADRVRFRVVDLRGADVLPPEPAEVIVSARAIHHFTRETIAGLYRAAGAGLRPGGFLFNLDHFAASAEWEDPFRRVRDRLVPRKVELRPHEHDAPPQPLSDHLRWLEEAGFGRPETPWRLLWTALVVARTPAGR